MRQSKGHLPVCIISCILFLSCGDLPCTNASAILGLIAFAEAETDTLMIRRYEKGSRFSLPRDTVLLASDRHHFARRGDTVLILEAFQDIISTLDYEIYIPGANRLFRISEIYEPQTADRNYKALCVNPILSYRLDAQTVTGRKGYEPIYLKK